MDRSERKVILFSLLAVALTFAWLTNACSEESYAPAQTPKTDQELAPPQLRGDEELSALLPPEKPTAPRIQEPAWRETPPKPQEAAQQQIEARKTPELAPQSPKTDQAPVSTPPGAPNESQAQPQQRVPEPESITLPPAPGEQPPANVTQQPSTSETTIVGTTGEAMIEPKTMTVTKDVYVDTEMLKLFAGLAAIALLLYALFSFLLWYSMHKLSSFAKDRVEDIRAMVAESARSAAAMGKIADSVSAGLEGTSKGFIAIEQLSAKQQELSKMQSRSYLSVLIGEGTAQDERGLVFEARPVLENNGMTPARKISYWARADILPWPLPLDFSFPKTEATTLSAGVLAPRQSFVLPIRLPFRVPADEVNEIKRGTGEPQRRLSVWGEVTYEDVFGDPHVTRFCQGLYWIRGEGRKDYLMGSYADRFNDAD